MDGCMNYGYEPHVHTEWDAIKEDKSLKGFLRKLIWILCFVFDVD